MFGGAAASTGTAEFSGRLLAGLFNSDTPLPEHAMARNAPQPVSLETRLADLTALVERLALLLFVFCFTLFCCNARSTLGNAVRMKIRIVVETTRNRF